MPSGHTRDESLGLIEAAIANNIELFCFPAHTTNYLCPLDRTVFKPLQDHYNDTICAFLAAKPENVVNKMSWPKLFREAFETKFNSVNMISGFKACGIHPWNPLVLPVKAFTPSTFTDTELSRSPGEHPLAWVVREVFDQSDSFHCSCSYTRWRCPYQHNNK